MKHPKKKQTGMGLIEVLITAVIVGLGILAVASLQGKLMGETASNKARSEAMQLANQKMEQLRDTLQKSQYDTICSAITTGYPNCSYLESAIITGSNENFFRYWNVTALPYAGTTTTPVNCTVTTNIPPDCLGPERKRIQVHVAWPYSTAPTTAPSPDDEHKVTVQGIIAYDNASYSNKLSEIAKDPVNLNVGSPTTNAGSSTVISDARNIANTGAAGTLSQRDQTKYPGQYILNTATDIGTAVYACTGTPSGVPTDYVPFILFDSSLGLYTRRVNNQSAASYFKESIELAEYFQTVNGVDFCVRKVRYNGGVIIPIKGRVYSNVNVSFTSGSGQNATVKLLGFDASESGVYCKFTPISSLSTTTSSVYNCFVGGNCVNGPEGTIKEGSSGVAAAIAAYNLDLPNHTNTTAAAGQNTIVTECPKTPSQTYTASPVYPANVYADVGPGGWRGNVGMIGLADGAQSYTGCFNPPAVARQYYTLRTLGTVATTDDTNEGINKPYLCHDFLVVEPPTGNSTLDCSSAGVVGALKLASNPTVRTLTTGTNVFDPTVDTSSCHVITGTVLSGTTAISATPSPNNNGKFDCTLSGTSYTCTGTAKDTSVVIATTTNSANVSCTLTGLNNATMSVTGCTPGAANATYNVSGAIAAGSNVSLGNGSGAYNPSSSLTFSGGTCTFPTSTSYSCTGVPAGTFTFYPGTNYSITFSSTAAYTAPPYSFTVTGNTTTLNIWIQKTRTVSVTVATSGDGTVSNIALTPPTGVVCTGTSSPYSCTGLSTWSGTVSASATCNGASTLTGSDAVASADTTSSITLASCIAPQHTLTVNVTSTGSNGAASGSVSDGTSVNCSVGATCTQSFSSGNGVTLTATASFGSVFTGWSGACTGTSATCTLTDMTVNRTVTANFVSTTTSYKVSDSAISYPGSASSGDWNSSPISAIVNGATPATNPCTLPTATGGFSCSFNAGDVVTITVKYADGASSTSSNRQACSSTQALNETAVTGSVSTSLIYSGTILGDVTMDLTLKKGAGVTCP